MSRRAVIATLFAAALVMTALVVTVVGPVVPIVSRPKPGVTSVPLPTIAEVTRTVTTAPTATSTAEPQPSVNPFTGIFFQITLVLLGLLVLAIVAVVVQALLRRRPHLVSTPEPSFPVPEVPKELLRSAGTRMSLLETGSPRNAIVAAWLDLEESARATGLPRHPSETSTEYTERVVGTWPVDPEQLATLAALYREARFSRHELGEPARTRAVAALRVLHADLQRLSDAPREGTPT